MPRSVEDRLERAYAAAGGRNAEALPWAQIIQAIMALLGGCATPAAVKRWAKRYPDAATEAINGVLKENGYFSSTVDRNVATDAAYDTFLKMTNDEILEYRR